MLDISRSHLVGHLVRSSCITSNPPALNTVHTNDRNRNEIKDFNKNPIYFSFTRCFMLADRRAKERDVRAANSQQPTYLFAGISSLIEQQRLRLWWKSRQSSLMLYVPIINEKRVQTIIETIHYGCITTWKSQWSEEIKIIAFSSVAFVRFRCCVVNNNFKSAREIWKEKSLNTEFACVTTEFHANSTQIVATIF